MIELTLEQAKHILKCLRSLEGYVLTPEQWGAFFSLADDVHDMEALNNPKPSPRFTVWETREGGSFFIRDTVERERYDDYESCIEREAQEYADTLNRCESPNG